MTSVLDIGGIQVGNGAPMVLVGGPCVIENESHAFWMASQIKDVAARVGVPYIFKASFDKANRTSIHSFRGQEIAEGLRILARIKSELGVPVLTDIHDAAQAEAAGAVVDVLQVPAFLCRQTDLLVAAARTGAVVNVKKGQFLSPLEAGHIVAKLRAAGNPKIMLTERGTTFGYNDLVVDMRSLVVMRQHGVPIMFDVTHSLQQPGAEGDRSGGSGQLAPYLLNAGCAVGVDAVFMEIHEEPARAPSDASTMVRLDRLEKMLTGAKKIDSIAKSELY